MGGGSGEERKAEKVIGGDATSVIHSVTSTVFIVPRARKNTLLRSSRSLRGYEHVLANFMSAKTEGGNDR